MYHYSTPWKHQKTVRFSDLLREQRKGALGTNELKQCLKMNTQETFYKEENVCKKLKYKENVNT